MVHHQNNSQAPFREWEIIAAVERCRNDVFMSRIWGGIVALAVVLVMGYVHQDLTKKADEAVARAVTTCSQLAQWGLN
jgi:uncharacterized protein YfeS